MSIHLLPSRPTPAPAHRGARASAGSRLLSGLLTLALLCGLVAFLGLGVGPRLLGYRTATMLTGSMAGTIDPGDVVVMVPKAADEVEVGDILTFHAPIEGKQLETHRVIEVQHTEAGDVLVRTKGDANEAADPWLAKIDDHTAWQTVHVVPKVGAAIRALRAPLVQDVVFWAALAGMVLLGSASIWGRADEYVHAGRRRADGRPAVLAQATA